MTTWLIALSGVFAVSAVLLMANVFSSFFCKSNDSIDDRLWVGLTGLISITYVIHFFLPLADIGSRLIIWCVAIAGLVLSIRRGDGWRNKKQNGIAVLKLLAFSLVVTCLSVVAMRKLENYDTGLYHFAAVQALETERLIPGWAQLHIRHAGHSSVFNVAGLLEIGPWGPAGYRLTSAVFSAISVLTFWSSLGRFVREHCSIGDSIVLIGLPSVWSVYLFEYGGLALDAPAAVVSLIATAKACDLASSKVPSNPSVPVAVSALAFSVRPLNLVLVTVCVFLFVVRSEAGRSFIQNKRLIGLSAALLLLHSVRALVLSGYALFPIPVGLGTLPWALPKSAVLEYSSTVRGWARLASSEVSHAELLSVLWLPNWLRLQVPVLEGMLATTFLSAVLIALSRRDVRASLHFGWFAALVLGPLMAWFASAPEPRFAIGQIALLSCFPLALVGRRVSTHASGASRTGVTKHRKKFGRGVIGSLGLLLLVPSGSQFVRHVAAEGVPIPSMARVEWPAVEIVLERGDVSIVRPVLGDQCGRHVWCSPRIDSRLSVEPWSGWTVVSLAD